MTGPRPNGSVGGPAKDLRVASLFSGCGGMDLGFEGSFDALKPCVHRGMHPGWVAGTAGKNWVRLAPTRFATVFANDIREGARKAWSSFFDAGEGTFRAGSIVDLVKRHRDDGGGVFPRNVDVVTGGFPCQDFSIAGKREGFGSRRGHAGGALAGPTEESRGKLYMWMREVVDIVRPRVFVAENVKGLVSLGDAKDVIQNDFADIGGGGYLVLRGRVLNAADYGAPQSRERVFFVGFERRSLSPAALAALSRDDVPNDFSPFPARTHSEGGGGGLLPRVPLRRALGDLGEPDETSDPDQKAFSRARWYGGHCQGNREVSLDGVGPTIRSEHHGNIEFRRLSRDHGGKRGRELDAGMTERRLTVRECGRIQTFPDSCRFLDKACAGVSRSEAYRLIGNAVPPLLAYHFAKRLEALWPILFGEAGGRGREDARVF